MTHNDIRTNKSPDETRDESTREGQSSGRTATINTDRSGVPIGIVVWLNADELIELGVDPETSEAVGVQVTDGELKLTPGQAKELDLSNDADISE